jgi:long-chain acyl-CoA synthetase
VLALVPGVREAAIVGLMEGGAERVHAVLVLDSGVTPEQAISQANQRLPEPQRIRSASAWPLPHLPRTEGTRKLKRVEIGRWAAQQGPRPPAADGTGDPFSVLLARYAPGRQVGPETTIEELGLSSLERIELMMAVEQRFQTSLDESAFASARTLGDVQALIESPSAPSPESEAQAFPTWSRSWWAQGVRRVLVPALILPLARRFARATIQGTEHLAGLEGPVIFAANHQSHMDTPVIVAALPSRFRYHLAPAMAKEFFAAHFAPAGRSTRERWTSHVLYSLAALCFNAFPLPQREAGARTTLRYVGELVAAGHSILIFPEGRRTTAGEIKPFQAGVGMMGSRLGLPIVPVALDGVDRVLHTSWRWPKAGPVRVVFGPPIRVDGTDYAEAARRVEASVQSLLRDPGTEHQGP